MKRLLRSEKSSDCHAKRRAKESKAAFVGAKFFGRIGRLEFFTSLPADVRRGCFFFLVAQLAARLYGVLRERGSVRWYVCACILWSKLFDVA